MQKIGVKRTKRNNALCKKKLNRQKLEKKLEDNDPDYVPNIFDAADLEDKGDVSNWKPPPETIAVLGKDSDTVSDGMQDIAPVVNSPLILSTDAFVARYHSPKIGGIGLCPLLCLIYSLTIYLSNCLVTSGHI